MSEYAKPLEELIKRLSKLPQVGPKSARRIAFYLIGEKEEAILLTESITRACQSMKKCKTCFNYTDKDECDICSSEKRDHSKICVVEKAQDVISMEKAGVYNGLYHVLEGNIDLQEGRGPKDIRLEELLRRAESSEVKEIILATNGTVSGEATALYLARELAGLNKKVTRIAYGIPMGGDLDFFDSLTINRAMENRVEM